MFKLSKYEIRKNIIGLVIMFGAIAGLELYFVISALADNRDHTAIASLLLLLATVVAYFGVLIYGVASYSKELNQKTGYMTFMTPISTFTIIGSKLISTLLAGIFFVVLLGIFALIDMAMFEEVFPETKLFTEFLDNLIEMSGAAAGELWINVGVGILSMLIESFAIVAIAYISITLTATAFQNKKWKGIVSAVIFVVTMIIVGKIDDIIPAIYDTVTKWSQGIVNLLPHILYMAVIAAASIYGSGKLLDKKVSL